MNYGKIRKTLEEQLQLLSERSHDGKCTTRELIDLAHAIAEIAATLLAP